MNRAEAKRLACRTVAAMLDAEFDNGSGWLETDGNGGELNEADAERFADAVRALIDELAWRGRFDEHPRKEPTP